MKSKNILCGLSIAVVLQLGILAGSAQTNIYLFSGSETNITLPPGTYIITAYGAEGGEYENARIGGFGAEMSAEFNFSTPTNLTLLVGGVGGIVATVYNYDGSGGGGGSFVVQGSTPLVIAGGGGGGGFLSNGGTTAYGGNGTITTFGSAGGGNAGGSGGVGGNGGTGGDAMLTGFGNIGEGADGGGGFYTDGTSGRSIFGYALPVISPLGGRLGSGGLSFEDGGAGGLGNLGGGLATGEGGFGGGGGGYSDNNYGFGGGGGGYSGGGGGGASNATTPIGAGGGGGSFIDSSAIAILAEVSGCLQPRPRPRQWRDYYYRSSHTSSHHHRRGVWLHQWFIWFQRDRPGPAPTWSFRPARTCIPGFRCKPICSAAARSISSIRSLPPTSSVSIVPNYRRKPDVFPRHEIKTNFKPRKLYYE